MAFKRFNTSGSNNYNSNYVGQNGELTWDDSNGLRLHDGNTSGGNAVGTGSLPSNASGFLKNDGSGNLSWGAANEGGGYLDYGQIDSGSGNMTINLSYKYHWLVNLSGNPSANRRYYLANGNADGDTIYFVPSTPYDPSNTQMYVDNFAYYQTGYGFNVAAGVVQLFASVNNSTEALIRATWLNSKWVFNGPVTKI